MKRLRDKIETRRKTGIETGDRVRCQIMTANSYRHGSCVWLYLFYYYVHQIDVARSLHSLWLPNSLNYAVCCYILSWVALCNEGFRRKEKRSLTKNKPDWSWNNQLFMTCANILIEFYNDEVNIEPTLWQVIILIFAMPLYCTLNCTSYNRRVLVVPSFDPTRSTYIRAEPRAAFKSNMDVWV